MTWSTILQIILYLNAFIAGGLALLAIQHLYAHFHPEHADRPGHGKDAHDQGRRDPRFLPQNQQSNDSHLSPQVKQRMMQAAEQHFADSLTRTTVQLERDLETTIHSLDQQLQKMGTDMARDEMDHYREVLQHLRSQANVAMSGLSQASAEQQAALKEEIQQQTAQAKLQFAQQLDAKLSDAVLSFILEAMQNKVDLGAQQDYLLKQLEEHKAELIQEVTGT